MKSINNWIKAIVGIAILVLIIFGIIFLSKKASNLKLSPFKKEEVNIEKTANVVTEIRQITEMATASFYEELVIHDQKPAESIGGKAINEVTGLFKGKKGEATIKDNIVIIAHGTVRAGIDLSKMGDKDIQIPNDTTIVLTVPKATILDVNVNPSDLDIYIEDGKWSHLQVTKVEQKARKQIKEDAIKDGILERASTSAKSRLTAFLKSMGYKEVIINLQ